MNINTKSRKTFVEEPKEVAIGEHNEGVHTILEDQIISKERKTKEFIRKYVLFLKHPPPIPQLLKKKVDENKIISGESVKDVEQPLNDEIRLILYNRRKRKNQRY